MHAIETLELAFARARARARIISARPAPYGGRGHINPHVTRFGLADGTGMDVFHVKPVYYETRDGFWRPLSEIAAYHGNHRIVLKPAAIERVSWRFLSWLMKRQRILGSALEFGYPHGLYSGVQPRDLARMGTVTAFPDPNPETTTVDGWVLNDPTLNVWATIHDAVSGTVANDSASTATVKSEDTVIPDIEIARGYTLFDTSAIIDGSSILSTSALEIWYTAVTNGDNDGQDYVSIVSASPASNTALATGDYSLVGTTEFASKPDLSSIATGAYTTHTLTAAGRAAVSKTGITKFGIREGHDVENAPVANNTDNEVAWRTADFAGTTSDPKLTVNYATFMGRPIDLQQVAPP